MCKKTFLFKMSVFGYIRVSTDKQDLEKQRHLLNEYSQQRKLLIDDMLQIEISSKKSLKERRIEELLNKVSKGDLLWVAELSRLGRNMLEVLNIIEALTEKGVKIEFVRQPELSTTASHGKLLLAVYSYFAEAERDFISMRTKQGLAVAKANGKKLGRPKGSKNKDGFKLDPYKDQILEYRKMGLSVRAIEKIINNQMPGDSKMSYNSYKNYIDRI
ncbi:MAG: recombinase family protein [Bacteroidales bacterium]|nr:recombinase family protein [Bacteroidales bacterium]